MARRRFLLTSLAGALASPLAVEAQRAETARIGLLVNAPSYRDFLKEQVYEMLTANIKTGRMDVNQAGYGENFCVIEHQW